MTALVDDTYAEAFRSIYAEVLITARDRTWLEHACNAATGHASSSIFCDCEAAVDRFVGPGGDESYPTPDGRPGAIVQFHVPRFKKDREKLLEKVLLHRLSQNVLTSPTAACFNLLDTEPYFKLGRKLAFFGDGHQERGERYGRKVWIIPIMGGEFIIDRRFGYKDGIMGGNLWFFADSVDSSLDAAERGVRALASIPGTIAPFPGGIASSGSKAGSAYKFLFASTNHPFCPIPDPGRCAVDHGNHYQRARLEDRVRCDSGRHQGFHRNSGTFTDFSRQLRRSPREKFHLSAC
jgi:formylmethanofuran--tetrahydromethanopterin N-formyltransferase